MTSGVDFIQKKSVSLDIKKTDHEKTVTLPAFHFYF